MIDLNDVLLAMSNIPVDDPIAEIWGRGLQGGYKIIEYTGSLPITINANGDALLDYRIYGADSGVGVATENLIDADNPGTQRVELEPNTDYCLCKYTGSQQGGLPRCDVYDENDNRLFGDYINIWVSYSFKNPSNGAYAIILFDDIAKGKLSFVKGRASSGMSLYPANYIPYGYKLPMTVSDGDTAQSVPVYIGENQLDSVEGVSDYVDKSSGKIVRRIKEYTFMGNEPIEAYSTVFLWRRAFSDPNTTNNIITTRFSHFTATSNRGINTFLPDNCACFRANTTDLLLRSTSKFTTADECKAYLKSQYDNDTPVKMWYIIETSVEEDPPVSFPEIPTIDGTTIIDYDGDPKPSQMYVKYKGKSGGA